MARQKLTETIVSVGQILEREASKLPQGVLCRARYNICNIGEMNRNKRIYERSVFEKVLGDRDIKEKLTKRSLYAHAEHPEGMQSSTEKIAGLVSKIEIGEKNVYAIMEVLDTPYGRICDTLLRAGCGLGTSTRAEGELEECINEADGTKFFRVVPESYNFVTVDWTADPSTYGAFPESVERDLTKVVKAGLEAKKIDAQYAATLLEGMKCKEAMTLCEAVKKEIKEGMSSCVKCNEYFTPSAIDMKMGKTGLSCPKCSEMNEAAKKCSECGKEGLTLDKGGMCHECWADKHPANETITLDAKVVEFIRAAAINDPIYQEFAKLGESEDLAFEHWVQKKGFSHQKEMKSLKKVKESGMKSKNFSDLEVEVDGHTYIVSGEVKWSTDHNYGADADGNRGVSQDSIEDVIISTITDESGATVQLTDGIQNAVDAKVNDMDLSEKKIAEAKINEDIGMYKVTPSTMRMVKGFLDEIDKILLTVNVQMQPVKTLVAKIREALNNAILISESKINEQGGSRTTGLGEIWKALDAVKDVIFAKESVKKLDESKTIKEKEEILIAEFKAFREEIAILEAENEKLYEIAESDLTSVRSNYTVDVMDFNKKLSIMKEEVTNTLKMTNNLKEKFEADKVTLGKTLKEEWSVKISELEKSALDLTQKIYEAKFKELEETFKKELKESTEHYNKKLMKLLVEVKVKEAGLESSLTGAHLTLLESLQSETEIESKLNEMKIHLKEFSFHSNEFKKDGSLTVPVYETVDAARSELLASIGQTAHLLKTMK